MGNLLLLDFDGTITQHDTVHTLITLSIEASSDPNPDTDATATTTNNDDNNNNSNAQPQEPSTPPTKAAPPPSPPAEPRSRTLQTRWQQIVQGYVAAYERHNASYLPAPADRTTLAQELDYLESVRPVEATSVGQVGDGGFFSFGCRCGGGGGPSPASWRDGDRCHGGGCEAWCDGGGGRGAKALRRLGWQAVSRGAAARRGEGHGDDDGRGGDGSGATVSVRRGFGEFARRMGGERGWDVAVVSVNWSDEFIRGVVGAAGTGEDETAVIRTVVANSVAWPGGYVRGPSGIGEAEPIVTAGDKLRAMESLAAAARLGEGEKVVYFGDSPTDLACLVAADLGVVMADDAESKLLRTLERIGFDVPHVSVPGREGSKLVWARDFEEVLRSGLLEGRKPRTRVRM